MSSAVRDDRASKRGRSDDSRALRPREWRVLALLGIPTFAFALAITVVTTYLPVRLQASAASTTVVGLLIGAEGVVALVVPLAAGAWSDRLRTSIGGRLPFVLAGTPPMAVTIVLLGLAGDVAVAAILVVLFFAGYYVAYDPYRALYPDVVPDGLAGRAQSTQALFRGVGTFLALVGGGLLIALADPAPFVVAALILVAAIIAFTGAVLRHGVPRQQRAQPAGAREHGRRLLRLVADRPDLRLYLTANALWECALGALKTFVVLYLTRGLGFTVATASLIIGGVALLLLVASPISGKLADTFGRARVMQWSLGIYGGALLVPFLATSSVAIALSVPLIALGGGVVMTLPYALLMVLMGDEEHGTLTGFYSVSRGIGTSLGPLLAGVAIAATASVFPATEGYQATWGICAVAILLSLLPLRRLRQATGDRRL